MSTSIYSIDFEKLFVEGAVQGAKDVSAVSCINKKLCLLASDGTTGVQIFIPGNSSILVNSKVISLGNYKDENDIEGLTNDGKYFYVVGSHGLSRHKSTYQESRYQLFRILLDKDGRILDKKVRNLSSLILTTKLKKYFRKPLAKKGLNIEGLGYYDKSLYLGLRSPVINGKAQILKVELETLFETKQRARPIKIMEIPLGSKRGIRSLEIKDNELYILSGSCYGDKVMPSLFHKVSFSNLNKLTHYGKVPYADLKAEGFEFIDKNKILVVYDSEENGLPLVFDLSKN